MVSTRTLSLLATAGVAFAVTACSPPAPESSADSSSAASATDLDSAGGMDALVAAAKQLAGQDGAPDVFDLSQSVVAPYTDMFAPYTVATADDIPADLKAADGTWTNDYGGFMSIGSDSARLPAPSTVADLLEPEYKGSVALNGDPTQAGAAFGGVVMAYPSDSRDLWMKIV